MTQLFDPAVLMAHAGRIQRAHVIEITSEGSVLVRAAGLSAPVVCLVLQTGASSPGLCEGDEVLVWSDDGAAEGTGVVLGRVGLYGGPSPATSAEEFARRPRTLILEAQEEIILRNGRARIRLSADGDIEVLGESFTSRCRRIVRLLAPMIKLN